LSDDHKTALRQIINAIKRGEEAGELPLRWAELNLGFPGFPLITK
jgi:hypothetical protein